MNELIRGGLSVTKQQAQVIDQLLNNKISVVGAGAGSGKTHTTVAAVLEILQRKLATLDQFILITFTKKAADELQERMEKELAKRLVSAKNAEERNFWRKQQERLTIAFIGTIHSFCAQILRTFGYEERVARESKITLSRYQLTETLQDVLEKYTASQNPILFGERLYWQEHELRRLLANILEYMHNHNLDPASILGQTQCQAEDSEKAYRVAIAELLADTETFYTERKRKDQVLDSSDLISKTAALLECLEGSTIVQKLTERYHYLFIDEFQDTDRVKKRLVDALRPQLAGLLVVGDRKQSIYGFRSADDSLIEQLSKETGVNILPLSISRRPTQKLLNAQNELFNSIGQRYPNLNDPLEPWEGTIQGQSALAPITYAPAGDKVSLEQGIAATASQIRELMSQEIDDPQTGKLRPIEQADIAILVRSNNQLSNYERQLQILLKDTGITVRSDAGGRFFEKPEIVSTFQMLKLVLYYPDDTALSLALRTPYLKGVDPTAHEQYILQYGTREGNPLMDWFEQEYPNYNRYLLKLRKSVRSATVPQILTRLYEAFHIRSHYLRQKNQQAANNLEKLRELARSLCQNEQALTLRQFVKWLEISILSSKEEGEALLPENTGERPNYVRITTIHRAKGLEFPVVIIPEVQSPINRSEQPDFLIIPDWGLEVNLQNWGLPKHSDKYLQELQKNRKFRIEEEMRLLYVAVTRAQNAVIFVGSGRTPPKAQQPNPDSEFYCWKDEIRCAWKNLQKLGAIVKN
ncbi:MULTISPECIES: UvrD-helicase domain-containing protein [unclassified Nodularia (in: cyanobacteria)]|uniref:UvrD-helicase domain-containing protein n=1 Tax=unclassified Nodularia (in: cyanobacteria) TaxID=2656917 RepID=UPI00188040AE|nr:MULTISPECIES: UvrD-helicase domain-containing protein [unclassified Nodularia (in: cyanobacteria)]MBE9200059.1 UvrD-helicase domain-containing protein [Nodularia sp. LEGE 06071]MCC2691963.1 UvrD-helicase domain-containing protein [Nodularia sp. LEGE 04288]